VPDSSVPRPSGEEDYICAAAMRLMELLAGALPIYGAALCRSVLAEAEHASNPHLALDEDFKRLFDSDAMVTATAIWRTSSFPSDEACALAGVEPGRMLPRATSTSLGEAARNDLGLPEQLARRMTTERFIMNQRRIVDALERFGFVERVVVRPNYKPLEATEKLHHLMLDFMRGYAALALRVTGAGEADDTRGDGPDRQAGK